MDIKIITIHAMHNPGSVFQAYALQEYLSRTNNVSIIDYRPFYFYSEGSKIKLLLKRVLYGRAYKSRADKFAAFIKNNLVLTSPFTTYDELLEAKLNADYFITGSDQLWNSDFPCGKDEAFYLDFVKKGKKISYSTSVGKSTIDENNMLFLKKYLNKFDALSVREQSTAVCLTKELNRKVEWVADPVFLLNKDHYMKFIKDSPIVNGNYVVVYLAPSSETLDKVVTFYKKKGLKIILAGGFTKRCACDQHIKDVGPEDFLNLIYYSTAVISTSFHATAFAHIFHKDFLAIAPEKNGERIHSLVALTGLEKKLISNDILYEDIDNPIDWISVDIRLQKYISHSYEYLNKVLLN